MHLSYRSFNEGKFDCEFLVEVQHLRMVDAESKWMEALGQSEQQAYVKSIPEQKREVTGNESRAG